jgi:hypothetical protein
MFQGGLHATREVDANEPACQADKTPDYEDVLTQLRYATDENLADAPDTSSEVALN